MQDVEAFLAHHGVKGMKWGVRKDHFGVGAVDLSSGGVWGGAVSRGEAAKGKNPHLKDTRKVMDRVTEVFSNPTHIKAFNAEMNKYVDSVIASGKKNTSMDEYRAHAASVLSKQMSDHLVSSGITGIHVKTFPIGRDQFQFILGDKTTVDAAVADVDATKIAHADISSLVKFVVTFHVDADGMPAGYTISDGPSSAAHMDAVENFLAHHGVKGMKWGVRRTDAQLGNPDGGSNGVRSKSGVQVLKSKLAGGGTKLTKEEKKAALAAAKAAKSGGGKSEPEKTIDNPHDVKVSEDAIRFVRTRLKADHEMSDREIQEAISRAEKIKRYNELFNKPEQANAELHNELDRLQTQRQISAIKSEMTPSKLDKVNNLLDKSAKGFDNISKIDRVLGGHGSSLLKDGFKSVTGIDLDAAAKAEKAARDKLEETKRNREDLKDRLGIAKAQQDLISSRASAQRKADEAARASTRARHEANAEHYKKQAKKAEDLADKYTNSARDEEHKASVARARGDQRAAQQHQDAANRLKAHVQAHRQEAHRLRQQEDQANYAANSLRHSDTTEGVQMPEAIVVDNFLAQHGVVLHADQTTVQDVYDMLSPLKQDAADLIFGALADGDETVDGNTLVDGESSLSDIYATMSDLEMAVVEFMAAGIEPGQLAHMDAVENFLAHHGVKGMKWGVRKGEIVVSAPGNPGGTVLSKSSRAAIKTRVKSGTATLGEAHLTALKSRGHRVANAFLGDKTYWKRRGILTAAVLGGVAASLIVPGLLPAHILASLGAPHALGALATTVGPTGKVIAVKSLASGAAKVAAGKAAATAFGLHATAAAETIGSTHNLVGNTKRAIRGNANINKSMNALGQNLLDHQSSGSAKVRKLLNQSGSVRKKSLNPKKFGNQIKK